MRALRFLTLLAALAAGLVLAASPALANDMTWFFRAGSDTASYNDRTNTFYVTDNTQDGHTAALEVKGYGATRLCISPTRGAKYCTFDYPEDVRLDARLCLYTPSESVSGCTLYKGFHS